MIINKFKTVFWGDTYQQCVNNVKRIIKLYENIYLITKLKAHKKSPKLNLDFYIKKIFFTIS